MTSERDGSLAGGAPAADTASPRGSGGRITAPQVLSSLSDSTGALTALLVTKEGACLAEAGDTSYMNVTAMAALVAGMFTATREVARLVGEQHFSILLQQGESRHIHIGLVTESTMMVVVFEDYQRIGRVRHEARKAAEQLAEIQASPAQERAAARADLGAPEFKEVALNLIDRIFVIR